MRSRNTSVPLGVYVHWPYCARICPYCDFNVYKNREIDAARWRQALTRDLEYWAERTGARPLRSLYFGGGTPSLAPIDVIAGVIETCADLWGFEPGAEITIEANPTDAEEKRFADFAGAGVNRLSLGVQSFDDAALKFLGRDHDGAAARRAVEAGLSRFARLSFDLIYALPGEDMRAWRRALRAALAIGAGHLSLYQLTIEEGTAFARAVARGRWAPPAQDVAADLFEAAQEETARAGLPAYEISNHARAGEESRHNLLYWTGGDYIGVGPGAHGRLTETPGRVATETPLAPALYLNTVKTAGCGASLFERLSDEAALTERLAMGLRLKEGVLLTPGEMAALAPWRDRIAALGAQGLLQADGARLAATDRGRRLLNAVLAALFA
ncbi:MAG: coproporphyrinogen III oxidase [Alphaproteobacteria bacterium]|nr:coproporphyrinogen III oxidase [Alphaproteobacteria bacterium]